MNPSIVLFGFGTVGKSVWQMLNHQCEFKAIAVRHLDAYRENTQNSPLWTLPPPSPMSLVPTSSWKSWAETTTPGMP